MNFIKHSEIKDAHAFLGGSNYEWLNYSPDKLKERWASMQAKERGTQLHEWAAQTIKLGIKQVRTTATLNMYINDAIGYRMSPEVPLYYSRNCFGTADAIGYDERKKFLRIHDLKTGVTPAKIEQLEIYAALFCLEYRIKPMDIQIELRIYQNDQVLVHNPTVEEISLIIDKIIAYDKIIEQCRLEG